MRRTLLPAASFVVLLLACSDGSDPAGPESVPAVANGQVAIGAYEGPYVFAPPVFDIAAAPNGNILVAETVFPAVQPTPGETSTTVVKEIRRDGRGGVRELVEITTPLGSPINGLVTTGRGSFFATGGALDLAFAGAVYHVSNGTARLVGDIEAFETANDPDAFEGLQWKDQACEAVPPFSAGPQSNPYHLARQSGGTVLVGDAAGNTVLSVTTSGEVDWVAILTPPVADGSGSDDPADWMVLFPLDAETNCYVQPVATSVAIGPDGASYAGELTGVTPAELGGGSTTGLSRVWRIEPGARNVVCPSADCQVALSGFTSIIDLAFGPEGKLHVVEYDEAGWWTAIVLGAPTSGTINRCDVEAGTCDVLAGDLLLPSAITFDKWGSLWVLENNLGAPTVSRLE